MTCSFLKESHHFCIWYSMQKCKAISKPFGEETTSLSEHRRFLAVMCDDVGMWHYSLCPGRTFFRVLIYRYVIFSPSNLVLTRNSRISAKISIFLNIWLKTFMAKSRRNILSSNCRYLNSFVNCLSTTDSVITGFNCTDQLTDQSISSEGPLNSGRWVSSLIIERCSIIYGPLYPCG